LTRKCAPFIARFKTSKTEVAQSLFFKPTDYLTLEWIQADIVNIPSLEHAFQELIMYTIVLHPCLNWSKKKILIYIKQTLKERGIVNFYDRQKREKTMLH
jgi:hypothetical protein